MAHKFEIFSAECNLCKNDIETLRNNVYEECDVVEYDLNDSIKEEI